MTDPNFAAQLLYHRFEPGAVTTSFEAHDHGLLKLRVEGTHRLFVVVLQFTDDEFASFSFQITDRLLTCMKVNADIYCVHSASFQSPSKRALSLLKAGGACFITSVPRAVATGSPPIARIEIARTVTRSLPLSVLTSSSNYSRHRHQPQARRHPGCNEKMIEEFAEGRHVRRQAAA